MSELHLYFDRGIEQSVAMKLSKIFEDASYQKDLELIREFAAVGKADSSVAPSCYAYKAILSFVEGVSENKLPPPSSVMKKVPRTGLHIYDVIVKSSLGTKVAEYNAWAAWDVVYEFIIRKRVEKDIRQTGFSGDLDSLFAEPQQYIREPIERLASENPNIDFKSAILIEGVDYELV